MNQKFQEARHLIEVRIVSPNSALSGQIRTALMQVGFNKISLSSSFLDALTESKETPPAMVFFDGENLDTSEVSAEKFVEEILKVADSPALITFFVTPSGQKLFDLLKCGAKGILLAPFTAGAVEESFERIQEGFTISDEVLIADTPQEAFAIIIHNHLHQLAIDVKEIRDELNDLQVLENAMTKFRHTVELAMLFSEKDQDGLFKALFLHFLEHADRVDREAQQTRLRKTREMLKARRRQS